MTAATATWSAPDAPDEPAPVNPTCILDEIRAHLAIYVCAPDDDLDLLTLWAAHTHLVEETYTTPRLLLDSPLPGSGKTTVLEHLERLCANARSMTSMSPALIPRLIDAGGVTTILIDEADRSLSPDKPGIQDLIAILNSGYKRGASRPVLVQTKDGWEPRPMSTFSPVAMAGNAPSLPEDAMTRTIRVLLLPDSDGTVTETDWEVLDAWVCGLGEQLATWAESVRLDVKAGRDSLPKGIRGRRAECWRPLKRVARAAGGRWPDVVDDLATKDHEDIELDRADGVAQAVIHVVLLQDLAAVWPTDAGGHPEVFVPTADLLAALIKHRPQAWSRRSSRGTDLTPQGLGRLLTRSFRIRSVRPTGHGQRGYSLDSFQRAWTSMRVDPPGPRSKVNVQAEAFGGDDKTPCTMCGLPLPDDAARAGVVAHKSCDGAP